MPVKEMEKLTLELPRDVVERIRSHARASHRAVEREAQSLIEGGLSARERLKRSADFAYRAYRDELAMTGRSEPSAEELMEQMRRIRQEVADELYPD